MRDVRGNVRTGRITPLRRLRGPSRPRGGWPALRGLEACRGNRFSKRVLSDSKSWARARAYFWFLFQDDLRPALGGLVLDGRHGEGATGGRLPRDGVVVVVPRDPVALSATKSPAPNGPGMDMPVSFARDFIDAFVLELATVPRLLMRPWSCRCRSGQDMGVLLRGLRVAWGPSEYVWPMGDEGTQRRYVGESPLGAPCAREGPRDRGGNCFIRQVRGA